MSLIPLPRPTQPSGESAELPTFSPRKSLHPHGRHSMGPLHPHGPVHEDGADMATEPRLRARGRGLPSSKGLRQVPVAIWLCAAILALAGLAALGAPLIAPKDPF